MKQLSVYIFCATSVVCTIDGYHHRLVGVYVAHSPSKIACSQRSEVDGVLILTV